MQYDIQGDLIVTLKQTRLVTTDMAKLTRFYETLSQSNAEILNSSFVQFQSEACRGLAIVELVSTQAYGEGVAESGANRSVILDFEVDNVDAEYERLQESVSDWVMPPKVMPWGARAIVFRDPDGNLVNMYSHP
jgi:predicted enzyme related to lactoylglutathione lyase